MARISLISYKHILRARLKALYATKLRSDLPGMLATTDRLPLATCA